MSAVVGRDAVLEPITDDRLCYVHEYQVPVMKDYSFTHPQPTVIVTDGGEMRCLAPYQGDHVSYEPCREDENQRDENREQCYIQQHHSATVIYLTEKALILQGSSFTPITSRIYVHPFPSF
jgi:hypothetical protein